MASMFRLAAALVSSLALLSACGGGYEGTSSPIDSSSQALKVSSGNALTLMPTELRQMEVSGGTRPYSVTSGNSRVVLASVSDGTLRLAAVKGDPAPVNVTVTDAKNAQSVVSVTVTNSPQQGTFSITPREVAILPGANRTLALSGGSAPFTATSLSPNIAGVTVSGTTLSVSGVAEGSNAEIRVFDSRGVTQSALVTVSAPIPTTSGAAMSVNWPALPSVLSQRPNNSSTYTIAGGTPPYSVTSSNSAVVSGQVRNAALIVKAGITGNATLTVSDSAGATVERKLYVQTTAAPLALSKSAVSGVQLSTEDILISGGMPPYGIVNLSPIAIASAEIVNGDILRISFREVGGPSYIAVRDREGNTVTLNASTSPILSNISLTPTAVTISENLVGGRATVIPIRIIGGKPVYQAFSSHPFLLFPTVSDTTNTVIVSTANDSGNPIAPCVDANTPVSIRVIDATGASAAATITIADNGACPITVAQSSGPQLSPSAITISEQLLFDATGTPVPTTLNIRVSGGTAPYTVFSSHPSLLSAQLTSLGIGVTTPQTAGIPIHPCVTANTPVSITLVDANGRSASTLVTIADNGLCPPPTATTASSSPQLAPVAITISELLSADENGQLVATAFPVQLSGGTAPYQVLVSHPNLLSASITSTTLQISTLLVNGSPVNACVDADTPVTVTVLDQKGFTSILTVNIADTGACTP